MGIVNKLEFIVKIVMVDNIFFIDSVYLIWKILYIVIGKLVN